MSVQGPGAAAAAAAAAAVPRQRRLLIERAPAPGLRPLCRRALRRPQITILAAAPGGEALQAHPARARSPRPAPPAPQPLPALQPGGMGVCASAQADRTGRGRAQQEVSLGRTRSACPLPPQPRPPAPRRLPREPAQWRYRAGAATPATCAARRSRRSLAPCTARRRRRTQPASCHATLPAPPQGAPAPCCVHCGQRAAVPVALMGARADAWVVVQGAGGRAWAHRACVVGGQLEGARFRLARAQDAKTACYPPPSAAPSLPTLREASCEQAEPDTPCSRGSAVPPATPSGRDEGLRLHRASSDSGRASSSRASSLDAQAPLRRPSPMLPALPALQQARLQRRRSARLTWEQPLAYTEGAREWRLDRTFTF